VAIHGSLGIRHWERLRLPRVTIVYGSPITFPKTPSPGRAQQQAAAERVFSAVRAMYEALDAANYGSLAGEAGDAVRDTDA
jgi:hypothetical protein